MFEGLQEKNAKMNGKIKHVVEEQVNTRFQAIEALIAKSHTKFMNACDEADEQIKQFRRIHKSAQDLTSRAHKACNKFDASKSTLDKIDTTHESHIKQITQNAQMG